MFKNVVFFIVIVGMVSCKNKAKDNQIAAKPSTQPPVMVDVLIAKNTSVSNNIEVNGSVLPNESLDIHPETNGRLTYLNVNDGATVKKGTVLAKINDADLQAQLKKLKIQHELALKTEERLRKLLAVSGINQADYDLALNQLNNLKADIEITLANIDKTIVKAPFDGILGLRKISPGAYVTPQNIITTLLQTNKVKVDFSVPEEYANQIQRGKNVQLVADNKKLSATIIATEPEINETTRNLKVRAIINEGQLLAGSFVKVLLSQYSNIETSIIIPTSCIIPEAKSKKVVVVKNGKGNFVNVVTGLRTADGIQVTKGLNVGDSVVISGVLFVRPNSVLKVKSVK
ncbi:MAG: efflux RND transporter periplasmic adaptor subunit [Chitinophagaceae bacterium]